MHCALCPWCLGQWGTFHQLLGVGFPGTLMDLGLMPYSTTPPPRHWAQRASCWFLTSATIASASLPACLAPSPSTAPLERLFFALQVRTVLFYPQQTTSHPALRALGPPPGAPSPMQPAPVVQQGPTALFWVPQCHPRVFCVLRVLSLCLLGLLLNQCVSLAPLAHTAQLALHRVSIPLHLALSAPLRVQPQLVPRAHLPRLAVYPDC